MVFIFYIRSIRLPIPETVATEYIESDRCPSRFLFPRTAAVLFAGGAATSLSRAQYVISRYNTIIIVLRRN